VFCDAREHPRADFFSIVEGEDEIRASLLHENSMRARLSFYYPTPLQQRRKDDELSRSSSGSCRNKRYAGQFAVSFPMF